MSSNPFNNLSRNDILDVVNSFLGNDTRIGNIQANINFLTSRNAAPSALPTLQGYGRGPTAPSPSWNTNDHSAEPPTPSHTFNSLNLNSVDEEDEFLYGDSNSVPEEQKSVQKDSIVTNASKPDTAGWSDEEESFGETHGITLSKLNSRLKKNLSDYGSQNKIQESIKFSPIKREEILIEDTPPAAEIHEQRYGPQKLETRSVSSPAAEKNEFPEINSTSVRDKSKYHIAAELLKKRTAEKSAISSGPSEKLGIFPGTSKNVSELNKSLDVDLKIDKSAIHRQNPRIINKKHVDNIRDYITGPQRKRSHLPEEFPAEKHARYESSRSFSPSRRHSPHRSSLASNKYKSSDPTKYGSPYSSRRSPSFDPEKRHSRYTDSRRRHSPSPRRWSRSPDYRHRRSHEKSTDYNKYKDRPRRSRSRSPGHYLSRSKTSDKKKISKSPKKPDYYSKKKEKSSYSSSDSFCSLSLGSSSASSDSSDDSSDDKKSSKKPPIKAPPKDKLEDGMANIKGLDDIYSKNLDPSTFKTDDISKKIADIFNLDASMLDSASIQQMIHAVQSPNSDGNQLLMNFLEQQLQQQQQQQSMIASGSSTFTSPSVTNVSSMQMPVIPSSETYAYPTVPPAPVQYVPPQMNNFPSMIPAATFPAPVMVTPPPAQFGPYLQMSPVPSNDSQYVTNFASKTGNIRPATLRTIPLSDSLPAPAASNTSTISNTNNIAIVPNNTSLQQSATKPKIQEQKSSLQSSKQSSENKTNNLKEKGTEKNISSSSRLSRESASEQKKSSSTSEQNKLLIIEKFKKMKSERGRALIRAKSASEDLENMRKMLDATFGKKISANEKIIYSKCKNQFNFALDMATQKTKEARRADENLNNFKNRLPTALQAEVAKIRLEQCSDEPDIKEKVSCLDQGDHLCSECYLSFNNIKEMLNHIQTPEHKKQMESSNQDWKRHFVKEQKEDIHEHKKTLLKSVKGAEFVKPLSGFYCALCKEVFLEESSVEKHLRGHQHYVNYDNYTKKFPLYVDAKHLHNVQSEELDNKKTEINKVQSKQLGDKKVETINKVQCEELDDKKGKLASEKKVETINKVQREELDDKKKKLASEKNVETTNKVQCKELDDKKKKLASEKKVETINKEVQRKKLDDKKKKLASENTKTVCRLVDDKILSLTCKRKKLKYTEDPKDSDSSSESENLTEVQKILAGKQKKNEFNSKSDSCTEVVKKTVHKYVFIGKCPSYKRKLAEKVIPWYKRKSILSKSEDNSGDSSDLCMEK